jgi:hypothetical protein
MGGESPEVPEKQGRIATRRPTPGDAMTLNEAISELTPLPMLIEAGNAKDIKSGEIFKHDETAEMYLTLTQARALRLVLAAAKAAQKQHDDLQELLTPKTMCMVSPITNYQTHI